MKCLNHKDRQAVVRGICLQCYQSLYYQVKVLGKLTWRKAEKRGLIKPRLNRIAPIPKSVWQARSQPRSLSTKPLKSKQSWRGSRSAKGEPVLKT